MIPGFTLPSYHEAVARAVAAAHELPGLLAERSAGLPERHSSQQTFGLAISLIFPILAFIIVALRVHSRVATKQFGLDDALIIVAMAIAVANSASAYMYIKTSYLGIHIWDLPPVYDKQPGLVWNFVSQVLYNPILALVKTSMLVFLLKLGSHKPGVRWCIYAVNFVNLGQMIAIFFVVIFQCNPIAYNWDLSRNGSCINRGIFYVMTAALTIFTDLLNLALPFWVFLDLKIPRRVKIALLFVFLLGGIVTIVGVVRLVLIYRLCFKPPGADPLYGLGFVTSDVETNLAIICASAPSLRGVIRQWFPHFFTSQGPSGYDDRYLGNAYGAGGRNPYGLGSVNTNITSRRNKEGAGLGNGTVVGTDDVVGNGGGRGGAFALRDLKGPSKAHAAVNSASPTGSEEEIMTYNGIMRTTNVLVHYDHESEREHKGNNTTRDRSRDRSSVGMRTSISGSI